MMVALLGASALCGQDLPQWVLNLSRLKRQAKTQLEHVPNYACLEVVSRFEKAPRAAAFKPLDTLRLEVAYIDGKEMFAPEGAGQFQDVHLSSFMKSGVLGSGTFVSVARNLFVGDAGQTSGWGEETLDGRATIWYGFKIPEMYHAYRLQSATAQAYVGQEGKYWVDAGTLELLRIQERAVDIPPSVGMTEAQTTIDYAKVQLGPAPVLLPQSVDDRVTEMDGSQYRNVTAFSRCREYSSESLIRFGPDDATPVPPTPPKKK
jgi:hypothetical protein